jgi:pimeloyl-ACP methyl ester carboxylesterase
VLADKGIFPDQDVAKLVANKIQDVSLHYVKGGHHVHMDDPEPVAQIVNAFLSKVAQK